MADRRALKRATKDTGLNPRIMGHALKARGDTRDVVVGGKPTVDRRRVFNEARRGEYIDYVSQGVPRPLAAELCGVHWERVDEYRVAEPGFADKEKRAEQIAVERLQGVAYASAELGNQSALEWLSKQHYPERYIPDAARAKLAVTIDGTVTHELEAGESAQRIMALQAKLVERKALLSGTADTIVDAEVIEPEDT